jgi:hypothetical protein
MMWTSARDAPTPIVCLLHFSLALQAMTQFLPEHHCSMCCFMWMALPRSQQIQDAPPASKITGWNGILKNAGSITRHHCIAFRSEVQNITADSLI